jgi:hypothetical protein
MAAVHDENTIRALAHELWEARGRREGDPERDWLEAESKLASQAVDRTSMESFPASDPPGSHLPDEPPVNADAMFAASREAATRANEQRSSQAPKIGSRDAPGG